jgi:hypothetical protein
LTRRRIALAAALSLLPGCGDLFPWHEPAVHVFVSAAVPQCPASNSLCAVLTPLLADAELLAQLGADTAVGKARLARATGLPWTEPHLRDGALNLAFPPPPPEERRSVYVLETGVLIAGWKVLRHLPG